MRFVICSRLGLVSHGLNNGLDVTDLESKSEPGFVAFDLRRVVRHQHAVVSDLPVYTGTLEKVDVTFVRKCFAEIQPVPHNVAEVYVEDLLARTKVADHAWDFFGWVIQHFADRTLAEIQTMVRAGSDVDEFLQAVYGTEHGRNTVEATLGHSGIIWVTSDFHFSVLRYGDDTLKEVLDSFPHHVIIALHHLEHLRIDLRCIKNKRAAARAATARRVPRA